MIRTDFALAAILVTLLVSISTDSNAQAQAPSLGKVVTSAVDKTVSSDPSGIVWRFERNFAGVKGVYVGVSEFDLPKGLTLEISSPGSRPALSLPSEKLKRDTKHWVPLMGSTAAQIELKGTVQKNARIRLKYSIATATPGGRAFSFQNPPRFEKLHSTTPAHLTRAARSVAALYWIQDNEWRVCSGFMVTRTHFVTNNHCVSTAAHCETARVVFGYQEDETGVVAGGRYFECKTVLNENAIREYDVSVLQLNIPEDFPDGPPPLKLSADQIKTQQELAILQHPRGSPLLLVRKGCAVQAWPVVSPTQKGLVDLAHQCDTAEGSSGSPVLNHSGEVVAIHHWGYVDGGDFVMLNRAIVMSGAVHNFLSKLK